MYQCIFLALLFQITMPPILSSHFSYTCHKVNWQMLQYSLMRNKDSLTKNLPAEHRKSTDYELSNLSESFNLSEL